MVDSATFQPKRINVPGLLSDDALQEQLKQFGAQKRSEQGSAPPPNSAVEMSSKIQSDYLRPGSALRSGAKIGASMFGPLSPALTAAADTIGPDSLSNVQAQQRRIEERSDTAAGVLGEIAPYLPLSGVAALGTLTEAERQVEAEARLKDAEYRETAIKEQAGVREKLRGLTDEQAAAMGLPIAPGGTSLETQEQLATQDEKQVSKAVAKTDVAEKAAAGDKTLQPTQTWWLDMIQTGMRSAAAVPTGAAKSLPILWELSYAGLTGENAERSDVRAWLDTVDATVAKLLPGDKVRAQDFASQLASGGGSMTAYMLGGWIAKTVGLPASIATTVLGATSGASAQLEDAEQFNATGLQKLFSFLLGGALGATEAVPINRMLFRADAATGGLVQRMLNNTLAGSAEEFLQELGQSIGTDVVAKWLYDENREMGAQKYITQATIGAIVGGLAGAATSALHDGGVVGTPPEAEPANTVVALVDKAIADLSAQFEQLPSLAEADQETQAETMLADQAPTGTTPSVEGPGGAIPVNERGMFEASHFSQQQLAEIDPAKRGTGPLRGGERQRLFGPDAVDRSYFGVGTPTSPKKGEFRRDTDPYHGEGLGPMRHVVEADPATIYNWFEDPLNLKAQLDRSTPASEQVTRYEKLIKDAGFKGAYFSESGVGQTAIMFEKTTPARVVNEATGLNETFEVKDPRQVELEPRDMQPLPGLTTSPGPVRSVVQAARAYAEARGLPVRRQASYVTADSDRGRRIAEAYDKMKHDPGNARVKAAYKAMADETLAQYQFVKATGLKVEFIEEGQADPYPEGPKQVLADLQKGHLWVFPTDQGFGTVNEIRDNPLLEPTGEFVDGRQLVVNDVFRIVHDFFGHGIEGSGFGARGEENAWQSHMRLYSQAALPAVTSETRGQNSWVNFGPFGERNRANQRETVFADQKTGLMPSWTWKEGVADDTSELDLLAKTDEPVTPARVAKLAEQVPGFKGVMKNMLPDERAKLKKQNAAAIVEIFGSLPDPKEMAAVAFSARAKKGWYQRSAEALVDIFGLQDAPRFAGLLAALSPQTSVESNAVNALKTWTAWIKAGRPTDKRSITRILGESVQGGKGEASVLPAWINNAITALGEPDALSIVLSGPKVNSFMRNLQGVVGEVTNDAWMANFANVDQTLFRKTGPAPGKGAGYMAMSAAVRSAAKAATKMTGETWTPAEIQETVWSWAKTLYEKASSTQTSEQLLAAGGLTAAEISATPDFASLFVSNVYRNILEKGGYDLESFAGRSQRADGGDGRGGDPLSAEGSGIAQRTFETHLRRAARRLDALRARRAEDERGESLTLDETFFPDADQPARSFTDEDVDALLAAQSGKGTATQRSVYQAEQTRPAGGVAATPGAAAAGEDVNLAAMSRDLARVMDVTVRQGRIRIKGENVQGQYDRKTDIARVKTMNDLSTIVHEAGHSLYFNAADDLKVFIAANDQLLMDAATALYGGDTNTMPKAVHVAEGFAEFFRVYTLNRPYAERNLPLLTAGFDAVLDKNAPEMRAGLENIGKRFEAWLQLPSAALVKGMIVPGVRDEGFSATLKELKEGGFGSWMQEHVRNTVTGLVNKYAGLNAIVGDVLNVGQENLGKSIDLKRSDDPRVLMRLAGNAGARAMVQTTDGVMGYRSTQPATRGLREALARSQGLKRDGNLGKIDPVRQQDFAAYLVALRGIDEYRRLAEGKIDRPPLAATLGDLQQTAVEMKDKYGDDFVIAAQIANEYGIGLWKKSYDAGLMSRETYEDGLDRQFYVPLQRDMSDKQAALGASVITGGKSIVKRFRGSDRNIIDPMSVLMHKTFAVEQAIARNDVAKALAVLSDRAGKAGALVERVPAQQLIGKQFTVKEVARQLTKDDTIGEADAQDLMEILGTSIENENVISMFRSEQASAKGENIVFYWEAGRVAAIQLKDGSLGADVVNVLNGLGRENMPMFVDLIASTSAAFRSAITSWPDFLAVNFIRDQFSAFILTDVGFKPFYTGLRGAGDEIRQTSWAKQYNAAMGIMGGMNVAALHSARVKRDIGALRRKGYLAKAFGEPGIGGAVKGMANVVELTETGTRIGIFRNAFLRAKKDGLSDWDASVEAAYTATDYIDFGLNGSRMTIARKTIPFLNAQLQGLYKMMRTLGADEVRQRKGLLFALRAYFKSTKSMDLSRTEKQAIQTGRKAWVKMSALGLISAALAFLYEDDPDYQEAGEYLRTTGWVIPTGNGRIAYIPKPFELAVIANFVERGIEHASGDPEAKSRFMRGLGLTLMPPTSPPAIQIAVEMAANKDFFTGREIVPDYMQALDPMLQYDNYTSELAKQLGEATGMSPMKIDHVMSGLGASAYRDLSTLYNATDPDRPSLDLTDAPLSRRFIRDIRRGSASSRDFWAYASTVDGFLRRGEVTYRSYLESGREDKAREYLAGLDEDQRAYAVLATHFKAEAKKLNPFYRGRQMTTIVSAMRREMVSDLGMEDTTTKVGGEIVLTSREKADLDEALSELARREMRNTLVLMKAPGWGDKKMLDTEATLDLIGVIEPRARAELERRVRKAKVYSAAAVQQYWPEVKDRLLRDGEDAFLKDILAITKVMR